jgi:hypothetical protein
VGIAKNTNRDLGEYASSLLRYPSINEGKNKKSKDSPNLLVVRKSYIQG